MNKSRNQLVSISSDRSLDRQKRYVVMILFEKIRIGYKTVGLEAVGMNEFTEIGIKSNQLIIVFKGNFQQGKQRRWWVPKR